MLTLSDGVKKWLVLLSTAPLPESWRVASRCSRLARLELAKAERTDLLVIGHPKSGNTWLRAMLSRVYQVRHGLPASVIVTSDELARRHPDVPRISATNGVAVCTSSGRVGPSLSFGNADAVVAIHESGAFTDAAATAVANRIHSPEDVAEVVAEERSRGALRGLIACAGDQLGLWGDFKLIKRN